MFSRVVQRKVFEGRYEGGHVPAHLFCLQKLRQGKQLFSQDFSLSFQAIRFMQKAMEENKINLNEVDLEILGTASEKKSDDQ